MNRLISATFEIEGKIIQVGGDGNATAATGVDPDEYDELGYSLSTFHGVCYRNRAVDEYRATLAAGDEFEQEAGAELPELFAVLLPNREYSDEEQRAVTSQRPSQLQWATGYLGGMRFVPFEVDGVVVEGAVVPVLGFDPFDDYQDVADTIIRRTTTAIGAARRQAARDASGSTGPSPSPGRPG